MIVYESAVEQEMPRSARPRRRELQRFLRAAMEAAGLDGEVSVLLTDDAAIRALNKQYRRMDKSTDVLSFPVAESAVGVPQCTWGDLVISVETAQRQAEERGHSLEMEIEVLLLHGLLHLAGYDHESDDGAMHRKEARLRRKLGLNAGLIERVQATPTRRAVRA